MKRFKKLTCSLLLVVLMVFSFIPVINVGAYVPRDIYVIWNDDNGAFHKKLIENVDQNDGEDLAYNYFSANNIGDGFKLSYDWTLVYKEDLDAIEANADYIAAQDKVDYLIGEQIALNPIRGINANTSKSHMGGMNFRFIIYSEGYMGLKLKNLDYNPDFIGGLFYEDHFDLGLTTKDKPAIIQTSMLNKEIEIEKTEIGTPFKSVKALDVTDKAVEVTNRGDGIFKIKFNSNYYDRVIFEVTTVDNETGYMMIARDSLNISFMGQHREKIQATLYYTKENSYKDYQVVANIIYKNGSSTTKVLDAVKDAEHDTNRDQYQYETIGDAAMMDNSKLKKCQFVIDNNENINKVYFTVVKKGATTVIDTYKGTFAGSKSGVEFGHVNDREMKVIYYEGMVA